MENSYEYELLHFADLDSFCFWGDAKASQGLSLGDECWTRRSGGARGEGAYGETWPARPMSLRIWEAFLAGAACFRGSSMGRFGTTTCGS